MEVRKQWNNIYNVLKAEKKKNKTINQELYIRHNHSLKSEVEIKTYPIKTKGIYC